MDFEDTVILDLASEPPGYCAPPPPPDPQLADLGDAPSSFNSLGYPMTAYGGAVAARFPTVFDPLQPPPRGPKHLFPSSASLGMALSLEYDADRMPDDDALINIDPWADLADRDGYDDALSAGINLPHCQLTQLEFSVTVHGETRPRCLSTFFDFNRDGDWADTLRCIDPLSGQPVAVPERAVADFAFVLGPGSHTLSTPPFRAYDPMPGPDLWLRLMLTDHETLSPDGRGGLYPYAFGETEDYLLHYQAGSTYGP